MKFDWSEVQDEFDALIDHWFFQYGIITMASPFLVLAAIFAVIFYLLRKL